MGTFIPTTENQNNQKETYLKQLHSTVPCFYYFPLGKLISIFEFANILIKRLIRFL